MRTMLGLWLLPPGLESTWRFPVLASLSALIMGAAKGGFAGSVGILSMPLVIHACRDHPQLSPLGVMLPLLTACDYVAVGYRRWKWDWRDIRFLVPGAIVGVVGGSAVLWTYLKMGRGTEGLAPAVIAGAAPGIFLHHRVNQRLFNLIVYGLLALMGAHLTVSSIQRLLS